MVWRAAIVVGIFLAIATALSVATGVGSNLAVRWGRRNYQRMLEDDRRR